MREFLGWIWVWSLPFCLVAAPIKKPHLIREEYIFNHEVRAALGADPSVEVEDLSPFASGTAAHLTVRVHGENPSKAAALSTLLTQVKDIAGINVYVRVKNDQDHVIAPGDFPLEISEARKLIHTALIGNRYFLVIQEGNSVVKFFVEFMPLVVQFYNDSLSNYIGCKNRVAQDVFYELLQFEKWTQIVMPIGVTTQTLVLPPERLMVLQAPE